MIPEQNLRALKVVVDKLAGKDIDWVVVGSTNLVLQGVDVEAHDIDIRTDKEGAIEIGKILKEYETDPVRYSDNGQFKSYYGVFTVLGVKVDVMGNLEHRTTEGIWAVSHTLKKKILIGVRDFSLPVAELKAEYQAYLSMGRVEKAKKIKEALDRKKPK